MIDSWMWICLTTMERWQKCHPHLWRVQRSTSCIQYMNHWYPLISVEAMPGTDAMARCWTSSCCAAVLPPGSPPNVAGRCPGGTVATVPRKAAKLNWLEDACMRNQSSSTPWDSSKTNKQTILSCFKYRMNPQHICMQIYYHHTISYAWTSYYNCLQTVYSQQ